MSWHSLTAIVREARETAELERDAEPVACPLCGTPLLTDPRGVLRCRSDGWTPH